jgi:hypothetical protein
MKKGTMKKTGWIVGIVVMSILTLAMLALDVILLFIL